MCVSFRTEALFNKHIRNVYVECTFSISSVPVEKNTTYVINVQGIVFILAIYSKVHNRVTSTNNWFENAAKSRTKRRCVAKHQLGGDMT